MRICLKNGFLLLLALLLTLPLCGCGKDVPEIPEKNSTASVQIQKPSADYQEPAEETMPEALAPLLRRYPENYLMAQTGGDIDDPVFGGTITHEEVTSVTFRDSLSGMPASAWDVSEAQDGTVMAWFDNGALTIAGNGGVTATSCGNLFSSFGNMTSVDFGNCFYTDIVIDMSNMFYDCESLTELDVSFFNTSNVMRFYHTFNHCRSLTSLNLRNFDTSQAVVMCGMFSYCDNLQQLDISSFDTSNVESFESMFSCSPKLTTLDLSHFDTSAAVIMKGMFYDCASLKDLNIQSFRTDKVTSMQHMFANCTSLTSLDLSHFDTTSVVRFGCMFENCASLETLDVSSFRTPKAERMNSMFKDCPLLTSLDLSGFDYSSVQMTMEMFYGCENLVSIGTTISLPEDCDNTNMYIQSGLS